MLFKFFAKDEPCKTCEVLSEQLATERTEKNLLLRKLMEQLENGKHIQESQKQEEEIGTQVIHRSARSFSIARAEREAQDKALAVRLAEQKRIEEINKVEKAVRLEDANI